MFGRKNDHTNSLSGQDQFDKRNDLIDRLTNIIWQLESGTVIETEASYQLLCKLKEAKAALCEIRIERQDSQMIWNYYRTITDNVENFEKRINRSEERCSRLDSNLPDISPSDAADAILTSTKKWKESK